MISEETIKKFKAILGIDVPAKKVIKLADVPAVDATGADVVLTIDGDAPIVGAVVTVAGSPAADGEYVLSDGTNITIVGGIISAVESTTDESTEPVESAMAASTPDSEPATEARLVALEKAVKELQGAGKATPTTQSVDAKFSDMSKVKNLESKILKLTTNLDLAMSTILKMNENSVSLNLEATKKSNKKVSDKPYSEMTNHEKVIFNRNN